MQAIQNTNNNPYQSTSLADSMTQLYEVARARRGDANYRFMSLYSSFDTESESVSKREALETTLSAAIKNTIKEIPELNENKQARIVLEKELSSRSAGIDTNVEGYSMFVIINIDPRTLSHQGDAKGGDNDGNMPALEFVELIPLRFYQGESRSVIGTEFDLMGLNNSQAFEKQTLILELFEDKIKVYDYQYGSLSEQPSILNDYLKHLEADPYHDERSPGMQGTHGNREDTYLTSDYVTRFLKQAFDGDIDTLINDYDFVMIYYSSKFEHIIQSVINDRKDKHSQRFILIGQVLPPTSEDLLTDIQLRIPTQVTNLRVAKVTDVLAQGSSEQSIDKILDMIRIGAVDTLFVELGYHFSAYRGENDELSVDSVEGAEYLDNATNALVSKVRELGGQVEVFAPDTLEALGISSRIMAKARF